MQTNDKGENIANDITVEDFTKDLVISKAERNKKQKLLFKQEPLLQIKNLKTYFPVRNGIFGGITDYVKILDDISFDVYVKKR